MKKVIVTGANGFTGSHVLESFMKSPAAGYEVFAACRTESKLPNWFKGDRIIGDLSDPNYIEKLTKMADVICHTAAWAEMNGTVEDSNKYFYEPTKQLIGKSRENGVKRFIFLSSTTSNPVTLKRLHSKRALEKIWPHYHNVIRVEQLLQNKNEAEMEAIILRAGLFTGKNYSLGLLPILLPRLKTHMVPWVNKGKSSLPLINGADVGNAFRLASLAEFDAPLHIIDVVGIEVPTVREVFVYLHEKYKYPLPHFGVSHRFAYAFARFVQWLHKIIPGDPLIVPAIVLLLEETNPDQTKARELLGYQPQVHWKQSIDIQIEEMKTRQTSNMKMNK